MIDVKNTKMTFAILLMLATTLISVGCTTAPPTIQTGDDAEVSFDGLHVVDNARADLAWARPDFDISTYSKVMLVGAGIEYAPAKNRGRTSMDRSRSGPFIISEETRTRFEALVQETFQEEFSEIENFELVSEAGPDVLMVRGGLLEVTSYVPEDAMNAAGRGGIYLSSIGEATLVLELRDSESGAILARSIDRRAAESIGNTMIEANRVTNAAEVRRLVRFWARGLRQALDGFANP
jgi:hypothetical protein